MNIDWGIHIGYIPLVSNRYGKSWIDLSNRRQHKPRLTKQERRVVELIFKGYTNREISKCLDVSHLTIRNYVSKLLMKFEARNRTELLAKVIVLRQKHHRTLLPHVS